jgi:hypothetical protein
MKQYAIIDHSSKYVLVDKINEMAKRGWRLVNHHSIAQGLYERHYAAMEKDL